MQGQAARLAPVSLYRLYEARTKREELSNTDDICAMFGQFCTPFFPVFPRSFPGLFVPVLIRICYAYAYTKSGGIFTVFSPMHPGKVGAFLPIF
jgi:hypothetical protein